MAALGTNAVSPGFSQRLRPDSRMRVRALMRYRFGVSPMTRQAVAEKPPQHCRHNSAPRSAACVSGSVSFPMCANQELIRETRSPGPTPGLHRPFHSCRHGEGRPTGGPDELLKPIAKIERGARWPAPHYRVHELTATTDGSLAGRRSFARQVRQTGGRIDRRC